MQHHALHPMCFKYVLSMSLILAFFEVKKPLTGSCLHILSFTNEPGSVFLCEPWYYVLWFYSTVITMDYGSTVGLTHFKYSQTWEMTVMMVTASMFTNQKQMFWKCEVITANIGNRLKLRNARSCIQFYFRNLGLHQKKKILLPCPCQKNLGWMFSFIIAREGTKKTDIVTDSA